MEGHVLDDVACALTERLVCSGKMVEMKWRGGKTT